MSGIQLPIRPIEPSTQSTYNSTRHLGHRDYQEFIHDNIPDVDDDIIDDLMREPETVDELRPKHKRQYDSAMWFQTCLQRFQQNSTWRATLAQKGLLLRDEDCYQEEFSLWKRSRLLMKCNTFSVFETLKPVFVYWTRELIQTRKIAPSTYRNQWLPGLHGWVCSLLQDHSFIC